MRPSANHIPRVSNPHSHCTFYESTNIHTSASRQQRLFRSNPLSSSYFKMRSSSRPAHRHPSYSHRTPSRPNPRFAFLRAPSAMFSTFNIIRASVYCTLLSSIGFKHSINIFPPLTASVFICTIICLAIAAHFQSVLSASDLSESCVHG